MPRETPPRWHPMMSTVEPEPGVWVLLDSMRKPYGVVTIVRVEGRVRFRAEHVGVMLGWGMSLREACERVHQAEIASMGPGWSTGGPPPDEAVTRRQEQEGAREQRARWVADISAKYASARSPG
ncbi:hypothetical protein [Microbacterium resistens]|uniref:hypothetical protein n=1 Tax=Microbacterium resistens TaxID=156977 RepID=UPI001C5781F1|nr:hypothetical protein [Microbacterium resistens]